MLELHIPGAPHPVGVVPLALLGLGVGFVAGMFGVGGGFLLTPILISIFGIPAPIAVGSALCQKCGTSIASFVKYRHLKRGEPRIDLVMIGGSVVGVDAGTRLLAHLTQRGFVRLAGHDVPVVVVVLDVLFIVLLSATTAFVTKDALEARKRKIPRGDTTIPGWLVTRVRVPPFIDLPRVGLRRVSAPMMAYLGFILGVASGLMGIGGGVLFMPILLYGFGLSMHDSAGTGVLLLFASVVVGTIEQALRGYVSLPLAMAILVGSSVGSQLGAITTHVLANRTLRLAFAVLVGATVVMIALDLGLLVARGRGIVG